MAMTSTVDAGYNYSFILNIVHKVHKSLQANIKAIKSPEKKQINKLYKQQASKC